MKRTTFYFRSFSFLVICALGLSACKHGHSTFTVTGTLSGLPVKEVYLTSVSFDEKPTLIMDSALVKGDKFELKCPSDEEKLYRVMLGDPNNAPWIGVVSDNASAQVYMDASQNGNYTVKGSPASQRFHVLFDSLHVILDRIQHEKEAMLQDTAKFDIATIISRPAPSAGAFYDYLSQAIRQDPSPVIGCFALNFYGMGADENAAKQYGINTPSYSLDTLTALGSGLESRFPGNAQVKASVASLKHLVNIPRVGSMAPDLALPDTSGKIISLSSLRGKYVLVDFWASWCGPCRQENPNVVRAYEEFKNKNFAIVGVSLDKTKEDWLEAIHKDHLAWTQVSDLQFWQSKAVETFQFDGIPYNVLLDPQGKIIATSLRGAALEEKLRSILQ